MTKPTFRRVLVITAIVASGALVLGACGGGDHSGMDTSDESGMTHDSESMKNQSVVPGSPVIPVEAGAYTFTPKKISLKAGEDVIIVLTSLDIAHDFYVDGVGHIVHAGARKTAEGGLMIDKPGTYKFWCTVKDHKKDGMTGTLTVTAS